MYVSGVCTCIVNHRRACARVTVVVLCVYLSVCYRSIAASALVYTCNQRYSQVSLRLFLDFDSWISKKPSVQSQYAKELELTVSCVCALSGPTKDSNCLKHNGSVECCFRD